MITKIAGELPSQEYRDKYTQLFEEIKEASGGTLIISDIADYFGNLTDIKELNDGKFLILPLEEPMFEIDADSRKITVPDAFKSNGLSVQGDHLAEVVFFKINRYFDCYDLNNCEIRINWKMGDTQKSSKNFIKNKDIEPGSIIFGWSVGKELTAKSGTVTFAVQFFTNDNDGNCIYSFNTMPTTITIKEGLILSEPEVIDNSSSIMNMLINSAFGTGEVAVGEAVWDQQLSESGTYAASVDLATDLNNNKAPAAIAKILSGKASAVNATVIEYTGAAVISDATELSAIDDYDSSKVYVKLTGVGSYSAKAQGSKFNASNQKIGAGEAVESSPVAVPAPKKPSVSIVASAQKALDSNYEVPTGNYAYLDTDGVSLKASAALSDGMVESDFGALSFAWMKGTETLDADNVVYVDASVAANRDSVKALTEEGTYKVVVKHFKNGSNADDVTSADFIVSKAPSAISEAVVLLNSNSEEIPATGVSFNSAGSVSKKTVKVKAKAPEFADDAVTGTISYSWEKTNDVEEGEWESAGEGQTLSISSEGWYRAVIKNTYGGCSYVKKSAAFQADDVANNG